MTEEIVTEIQGILEEKASSVVSEKHIEKPIEQSKNNEIEFCKNTLEKVNSSERENSFKKPDLFHKPETTTEKSHQSKGLKKNASARESKPVEKNLEYIEPLGACLPKNFGKDYSFEVLKSGSIINTINLMKQSFWAFGRLESCHIVMEHPTVSRYHAVLQYLGEGNEIGEPGFYLYDLSSTHGTFLNKNRLKPKSYVRIQVGHMLKLGCSTRSYILNGPEEDEEKESELSVTELKQKRAEELERLEKEMKENEKKKQEEREKEEAKGIDWGLGEDADEEVDLSENPFAQTNNEELFVDDPKKALRGFFEREGLDLQYDCTEHGMGQFLCKVELPLDDEMGHPIVAEVLHKGKKKEAVIQCALEACKILDRHGVLRQANHESRKRKSKNWEENDYYDSDEDTFLDRTGTIEKKREKRMKTSLTEKIETYDSLCEQEKNMILQIDELEKKTTEFCSKNKNDEKQTNEEDSLDAYMTQLSESKPDRISSNRMKAEITKLKTELTKIRKLINIVKPAELPALITQVSDDGVKKMKKPILPMIGKRKTGKVYIPLKPAHCKVPLGIDDGIEEDEAEVDGEKNRIE